MRAYAILSGLAEEHVVGHGDLIGRTSTAAVVIDDPRVSEAHAIVSLRKDELRLLALRRMVIADGQPTAEVVLRPGLRITIVDDVVLTVERVQTPDAVLAVTLPSGEQQILPQVASLTIDPPRLHGKLVPEAAAVIWSTGDRWRLRHQGHTRPIAPGDRLDLGGHTFGFELLPLSAASAVATDGADEIAAPIKLVAYYDSVQIFRRNQKVHTLGGTGARILSELVACGGPTHWEVLAREVWPDEADVLPLRHRWDVSLGRLRSRLRAAGIRELIRSDGTGQLALELYVGDTVEDKT
ncbi:MAG: FHA domain-containing protein [Kofleriaceae bacterium]